MLKKVKRKEGYVRLKMLILFKERPKMSYKETSELIGYSDRQLKRWWKELLKIKKRGRKEGVSEEKRRAIEGIKEEIRKGKIKTIKEAKEYLKREHGIEYSLP
ncbi:MAG: hypothetical protein GXO39_02990, partial [Thermotogae bacterium]|nr:hypothetical protein [Thermotogota bacterium]